MPIRKRVGITPNLQLDFYNYGGERIRKTIKPFPLSNWLGLPCIYFLMMGDKCVYVGKTTNLPCRLQHHIKDTNKHFDGVYYLETKKIDLLEFEADIIFSLKPEHNKKFRGK